MGGGATLYTLHTLFTLYTPLSQRKKESSAAPKSKGKRQATPVGFELHWQPDRAHALTSETRRNDFQDGLTPQPPMNHGSLDKRKVPLLAEIKNLVEENESSG